MSIKRLSFKWKLLSIVSGGIVLVGGTLAISILLIVSQVNEQVSRYTNDVDNMNTVAEISIILKQQVQAWKDLLLRGSDPSSFKKYSEEVDRESAKIGETVQKLISRLPEEDRKLASDFLEAQARLTEDYRGAMKAHLHPGKFDYPSADKQVKGKDQKTLDSLKELNQRITHRLEADATELISSIQTNRNRAFLISAVILTAVLLFSGIWMARISSRLKSIADEMSRSGSDLERASASIAQSTQDLASASSEQAAAIQESAAAVEELSAMVRRNTDSSRLTAETSTRSEERANEGKTAVGSMITSMQEIHDSNQEIVKRLDSSNGQLLDIISVIREIGEKTKIINDIVFQTKLLSFNASVEAARAGEQGKGFAVVAEEVGNLAQMSGNAAKEISEMLNNSIQKVEGIVHQSKQEVDSLISSGREKVEAGTQVARLCATALDGIVENVARVATMAGEISGASEEQARGISELNKAIAELDQATQQNAKATETNSQAADSLSQQASSLNKTVHELESLIDGA